MEELRRVPRVLLLCSDKSFLPWAGHRYVGRLLSPALHNTKLFTQFYTGIDNACFNAARWNERSWLNMLLKYSSHASHAKWVALPDVVGDAKETYIRFQRYLLRVRGLGYKIALVLQDGVKGEDIPWNDLHAVFIGGTDAFKESNEAMALCYAARGKNKLIHVGRVNTERRLKHFIDVMDSFDGLSYSYYSKAHLPRLLKRLEEYGRSTSTM